MFYRHAAAPGWEEHRRPQDRIARALWGMIDFVMASDAIRSLLGIARRDPGEGAPSGNGPQRPARVRRRCLRPQRGTGLVSTDWLRLDARRVLVAGGAGTIGTALVDGFLAAGARVGVADLSNRGLARLDARVVVRHAADLSDAVAARAAVAAIRNELGGLDVVVHCVGINDRRAIEDFAPADWDRIIGVNLTSAFNIAAEALAGMKAQRDGRIVFFSSVAGRSGHRHHGPYAASKGAINQLMRVIAHESAPFGVTANAVAPGYMDTELTHDYLAEDADKRAALVGLIPAGRFGLVQEVVDPVLFLCSPRAGFVTGQVLYIDGGRTVV
jgi:NAD(P)-dependent dehydrogenase (short-subunit alcohol dehydrogenase family)